MPEEQLPSKTIGEQRSTPDATGNPEQSGHGGSPVKMVLALVQANRENPSHHYKITCQVEKDWWEKMKPFVEIVGILLLAAYTAYTIKMYKANKLSADAAKESADTAENSFQMERRRAEDQEEAIVLLRTDGPAAWIT